VSAKKNSSLLLYPWITQEVAKDLSNISSTVMWGLPAADKKQVKLGTL
jgi:hypothetical protein